MDNEKSLEQIANEQEEYCEQMRQEEASKTTVNDLEEAIAILTDIVLGGE